MPAYLHQGDLPANVTFQGDIAIDSEAMGLNIPRDRLCLIQLSDGQGDIHLVQFAPGRYEAPNLKKLLSDPNRTKILHFARFDVAIIHYYLGVLLQPIYCTKIASKLVRTYTDSHGLKDLCRELIGVTISKQQQSSDWGNAELTKEQVEYAAADVLYLHRLRAHLTEMLTREGRLSLAEQAFKFLPHRAVLDTQGFEALDLFAH